MYAKNILNSRTVNVVYLLCKDVYDLKPVKTAKGRRYLSHTCKAACLKSR